MRALLGRLTSQGVLVQDGPWLRLTAHRVTLSAEDERFWSLARALDLVPRPQSPLRTRDTAASDAAARPPGPLVAGRMAGALEILRPTYDEAGGGDGAVGRLPGLGLLAGAGRPVRFVDGDRRVRERPEGAVERIDGVDAQVHPLEAAALER